MGTERTKTVGQRSCFAAALVSVAAVSALALPAAAKDQSVQDSLAAQRQCAEAAQTFLASKGWKKTTFSKFESAYNERLKTCFVLAFDYIPKDDFRTIDLYDAIGGRRYATYNGHDICDLALVNPKKCQLASGQLWFDGDDSGPPDFSVGFKGLLNGGESGDEATQRRFLERVRSFMKQ